MSDHEITKEIRFAVVMYGGISLAIYMNGIAQELLSLARSTADEPEKQGTVSVYKEIAEYLSKEVGAFDHKFVVDIISGTSAGGINGICLAKSLVRGLKDLKVLEKIWLDEGDIDKLLNDSQSQPFLYPSKEPKSSLFNSQRMYAKLLQAFTDMEKEAKNKPHVEIMDLFVTATDLRGLQRPVRLSAGKAYEHIYKHVFPFRYRKETLFREKGQNDFTGMFDPMLAFAARCTSSIPPAFEPVKVCDTLDTFSEEWQSTFFQRYESRENGFELEKREFADGGYLDNRPFGHAINAIHARQAACPIERKLLFIDPSPEPKDAPESRKEISFVKNSMLTLTLPRDETIREEICVLLKRNDWIKKVRNILDEKLRNHNAAQLKAHLAGHEFKKYAATVSESDLENLFSITPLNLSESDRKGLQYYLDIWKRLANPEEESVSSEDQKKDFQGMSKALGGAYPAYHYTRMNLLTDQLALMIARAGMVDEDAEVVQNIREHLRRWRTGRYNSTIGNNSDPEMETENMFFRSFDLDFRIRRLSYIRKTIEKAISKKDVIHLYFGLFNGKGYTLWHDDFLQAIISFYQQIGNSLKSYYLLKEKLLSFGEENPLYETLLFLIRELSCLDETPETPNSQELPTAEVCKKLKHFIDSVNTPSNGLEKHEELKPPCKVTSKTIKSYISRMYSDAGESNVSETVIYSLMSVLDDVIADQKNKHEHGTFNASEQMYDAFSQLSETYPEIAGRVRFIYDFGYDLYDATTFQLLASGDYGEGNVVDIYRISPADATSLWDESTKKKSKLAGSSLAAFGGFLDREWRRNDILWGRLDGAERIITALLPEKLPAASDEQKENNSKRKVARKEYIRKAQNIILREVLDEWLEELELAKLKSQKDKQQYELLMPIREALDIDDQQEDENGEYEWEKVFKKRYDFHRELEPEPNLRRLGRGAGILSSMIERLDDGKGIGGKISEYLKKLNWILLGMLDFSTPKTMAGVLASYWLQLLMLVSVVMISLGYLFDSQNASLKYFGFALLAIDIVVLMLRQLLATWVHKIKVSHRIMVWWRLGVSIFSLLFLSGLIILSYMVSKNWQAFWPVFQKVFRGLFTL